MDIKNCDFHCPHCTGKLNADGFIMLNTRRQSGEEGTIRLATTFGNYEYLHEPRIDFNQGEIVAFNCPSCKQHVHSEKYKDYAILKMHVTDKIIFDVLFSREAGKRRTYIVTEDGIESYSEM
ncbi:MAG: hypothetical protein JNJ99_16175 [Crocinitomicaceae bacterium]|nr:hypothetical protein [Crocinitomicaceae bacterium]